MINNEKFIAATLAAREYLKKADGVMGALIDKLGIIEYKLQSNYYIALINNIVGQQLSAKAANTIWERFQALFSGEITPEKTLAIPDEELREAGLSRNKAAYIKNIASAVSDESLPLDKFDEMSDARIIECLTKIKGIGEWTAEMFLIFSLGRPDVFSKGDGGLARAVTNLYGLESAKDRLLFSEIWQPYRSIASLYLWRSLDNGGII